MGTSRPKTETQLEQAKAALELHVKALQAKGTDAKKFKTSPQWRSLDAKVRQIRMRLRKIAEIEANNQELAKLKVERTARLAAEKAERKAGTSKKPKAAKDEGKKPKGEAKGAKKEKPPKEKAPKQDSKG
jgi:hypothetical protein